MFFFFLAESLVLKLVLPSSSQTVDVCAFRACFKDHHLKLNTAKGIFLKSKFGGGIIISPISFSEKYDFFGSCFMQ